MPRVKRTPVPFYKGPTKASAKVEGKQSEDTHAEKTQSDDGESHDNEVQSEYYDSDDNEAQSEYYDSDDDEVQWGDDESEDNDAQSDDDQSRDSEVHPDDEDDDYLNSLNDEERNNLMEAGRVLAEMAMAACKGSKK